MVATAGVEKQFYSPHEVATIFDVSDETVARWLRSGQIRSVKIENTRRVHRSVIEELTNPGGYRARATEPNPPVEADEIWG